MTETNGTPLSPRQAEVLAMLKDDKTTGEIAAHMKITTQGVHGHIRRLRERGFLPATPARKAPTRKAVSIDDTLDPLRTVIERQREQLLRQDIHLRNQTQELQQEIADLAKERDAIQVALERLETLELSMAQPQEVPF